MPKSILIIAAERGLGLGLAGQFFQRGWSVTGTARPGADTAALTAVGIDYPSRLSVASIDVTVASQIGPFLTELGERRFDVIYLNAGIWGAAH
jgi:NAD(P)-dependent dehydrogenase (short-subunit alcohol dehydrogenase family)